MSRKSRKPALNVLAHGDGDRPREEPSAATELDAGAVLYSDRLGIVRTSALPGWVEEPGVPAQEFTRFVPKPVRVLFGSSVGADG